MYTKISPPPAPATYHPSTIPSDPPLAPGVLRDKLTREGVKGKPFWFLFTFTLSPSHNSCNPNTLLLYINLFRTFFHFPHFHLSSTGKELTDRLKTIWQVKLTLMYHPSKDAL